jgi:hypothetical protein
LRFSSLVLDLGACMFRRESGEVVPLTRPQAALKLIVVSSLAPNSVGAASQD